MRGVTSSGARTAILVLDLQNKIGGEMKFSLSFLLAGLALTNVLQAAPTDLPTRDASVSDKSRGWSHWESLGGQLTSAPSAVAWDNGRLDIFVRGTDNALHHKWYNSKEGWSGWESLGGILTSGPASASWNNGRLDVFVRGTDNQLHHKWYEQKSGWSGWSALGGILTSEPSATSWDNGRLDVFVRGADNALWHKWYNR